MEQNPKIICKVEALSEWERELWQRYGTVFYPQTEEGRRLFALQQQALERTRKDRPHATI